MSDNNEDFEDLGDDFQEDEPSTEEIMKSKTPIEPIGEGKKISLYFRSTIGPERTERILVGSNTSVEDLKETLGHIFNLGLSDFHLIHEGRTLDPEDTIGNFDPQDGDLVLLIPVSTAGNQKKSY
ncbi:MAG: ubiquitin-like domain-containing protein [Candidatus Hodarchaeota archaeon]